jgi:hypothetical protein
MYTVTLYKFSCNGNGRKNCMGPFNRDVLHLPLCEDSDKILEGRTSTYIFSISLVRLNAEPGKKKSKYGTVYCEGRLKACSKCDEFFSLLFNRHK